MQEITFELLRKHAEHNDGCLGTLEEISLNQLQITSGLDVLNSYCPKLKIAYLQGNLIENLGRTGRLKQLEYVNVALNNLKDIRGLEKCESLKKLDLTLNFIASPRELLILRDLPLFEDLYTTGNPCEKFSKYNEYLIATLPSLKWLNGKEIKHSERIRARSEFTSGLLEKDLENWEKTGGQDAIQRDEEDGTEKNTRHDPEGRKKAKKAWRDMHEGGQSCQENIDVSKTQPSTNLPKLFKSDGVTPLNVNKAKIPFKLTDQGDHMLLTVSVYKYLEKSLIDVDVETTYVRVTLKDEVLQLRLEQEVLPDSSSVTRCSASGELTVKMPKSHPTLVITQQKPTQPFKPTANSRTTIFPKKKQHWRDMLKIERPKICEKVKAVERADSPNFEDDPDVPPLE